MSGRWLGLLVLWATVVVGAIGIGDRSAEALPLYAQRGGRTCANCHVSPTLEDPEGWENPALPKRKCSLSCVSCHTNPTGGGPRNTSGRYYGLSTLAMLPTQPRGYGDLDREMVSREVIWKYLQKFGKQPVEGPEGRSVPSSWDEVQQGIGAGQKGRWTTVGKPAKHPDRMAFWDGRYADLSADPLFFTSGDLRFAYWTGTNKVFPMQVDLSAGLHPVEHLTLLATLAGRGSSRPEDIVLDRDRVPVFPRTAVLMVHELPYMTAIRGGIFQPAFGTHVDDHTLFVRDWFEMDVSDSLDTVIGGEVSMAPNYPYANLSIFGNDPLFNGEDTGWGLAAQGGMRELGWNLGGSLMVKQRGGQGRGDLYAGALTWGVSPFSWSDKVPLTLMGEVAVGHRVVGGGSRTFLASYAELAWTIRNGLLSRFIVDFGASDLSVRGSEITRLSLRTDFTLLPGLTLSGIPRLAITPGSGSLRGDFMLQTHLWF